MKYSSSSPVASPGIAALRQAAQDRIGLPQAARKWLNHHLPTLPEVVPGDFQIAYMGSRGEPMIASTQRNHALWLITVQTAVEAGGTTHKMLGSIFRRWAKETLQKEWPLVGAEKTARKYIQAAQELSLLSEEKAEREYYSREHRGYQKTREFPLAPQFLEQLQDIVEGMRESAPMVCKPLPHPPRDWAEDQTGIGKDANLPLITGAIGKQHVSSKAREAINALQRVQFVLSPAMRETAQIILDNPGIFKPTAEETLLYEEALGWRKDDVRHFPVTLDRRTRMYYRGGILTPQGTDFAKAALQFALPVAIGKGGEEAIRLTVAAACGVKGSIHDRVQWTLTSESMLSEIKNVLDCINNGFQKPCQALVAIRELQELLTWEGPRELYLSNLVCHQDGTCNGLQHMAAITKDRVTAERVNCCASSPEDEPQDLYGAVAETAGAGEESPATAAIQKYARDMAKNPVMITGYGAGEETVQRNTAKFLREHGDDPTMGGEIGERYVEAIQSIAPAVYSFTNAMKRRAKDAFANGITTFTWKTADGCVCKARYMDIESMRVRAGNFNALCPGLGEEIPDEVKMVGAAAPNLVHSIDAAHLREVVRRCNWPLVAVHDSVGCHAGHYAATGRIVREAFVEVHSFDAFNNWNAFQEQPTYTPLGDYSPEEVLQSTYFFS